LVNECKEKWRNVRSSFLRSLKPPLCGSKTKKPYYLKEYLQFILPFVKPLSNVESSGDIPEFEFANTDSTDSVDVTNASLSEDADTVDIKIESTTLTLPEEERSTRSRPPPQTMSHRRKRSTPDDEETFLDYLKNKSKRYHTEETTNQICKNESIRYFLLSLLPEFETMTDDQIRMFKIKVMMLISDMKSKPDQGKSSPFYSDS
ncbi:uncharacterized protein LOC108908324, partial [Anoplophora glabripennis]|uniref:uncharacterized protein LOC108908324 n=1 Tax=Anoplophora glabripennis TaxID=217634 RepID=UPI000873971A